MLLGIRSAWTRISIWGDLYWTWQSWLKACGLRRCMGHRSEKRKQLQFSRFIANRCVKDHLSFLHDSMQYGHGMHDAVSWCITFWERAPKHLSKGYHQFSFHYYFCCLSCIATDHDAYWCILFIWCPSTFPRIGMIFNDFRFAASGVSWQMEQIYMNLVQTFANIIKCLQIW